MKRSEPKLMHKITQVELKTLVISVITEAELLYGIKLSGNSKKTQASFEGFVKHVQVLDWSRDAAEHYADIRSFLKKHGIPIGANDLMIAAHARSSDCILVTNNTREFGRIKGLKIENWTL